MSDHSGTFPKSYTALAALIGIWYQEETLPLLLRKEQIANPSAGLEFTRQRLQLLILFWRRGLPPFDLGSLPRQSRNNRSNSARTNR